MIFNRLISRFIPRDEERYGVIVGNLLFFKEVKYDAGSDLSGVYSVVIRSRNNLKETWTRRIRAFRRSKGEAIAGWTRILVEASKSMKLDKPVTLVCALPSEATEISPTEPLIQLGQALAESRGWDFRPELIAKRAHHSLSENRLLDSERLTVVRGAYACGALESDSTVVVLDDYCNGGATLGDVARAVRKSNPGTKVFGLVLGRTRLAPTTINSHLSNAMSGLWRR